MLAFFSLGMSLQFYVDSLLVQWVGNGPVQDDEEQGKGQRTAVAAEDGDEGIAVCKAVERDGGVFPWNADAA